MRRDIDTRIEHLQREGEHDEDIAALRQKRTVLQSALTYSQALATPALRPDNYLHPSEAMLSEARAHGVDLTDARVQQLLAELHSHAQESSPPSSSRSKDHVEQALQRLYAREASDLVHRILEDTSAPEKKEMLLYRRQQEKVQREGVEDAPEQIEVALRQFLLKDYLDLYGRYYQGRATTISSTSPPSSKREEQEREEWVQQVLEVLQRYSASPLASDRKGKTAPRSWMWNAALWVMGFLIMQLILFGYRYYIHPLVSEANS